MEHIYPVIWMSVMQTCLKIVISAHFVLICACLIEESNILIWLVTNSPGYAELTLIKHSYMNKEGYLLDES